MTEWSLPAQVLLPLGLGLLGFVEPCAVGSHIVVLGTLSERSTRGRLISLTAFVATRTLAFGGVGIIVAFIGQHFVAGQKAFWLLFGLAYAALGVLYLTGRTGPLRRSIGLRRPTVNAHRDVAVLGIFFAVNVPACAAPLLFAVAGSAAGAGAPAAGFGTMALFGFALSAPLFLVVGIPKLGGALSAVRDAPRRLHRLIGGILIAVGFWSMWFGLFVDPADWQL